jgi:hypothetical protein
MELTLAERQLALLKEGHDVEVESLRRAAAHYKETAKAKDIDRQIVNIEITYRQNVELVKGSFFRLDQVRTAAAINPRQDRH